MGAEPGPSLGLSAGSALTEVRMADKVDYFEIGSPDPEAVTSNPNIEFAHLIDPHGNRFAV